jgi:hypothetical protein
VKECPNCAVDVPDEASVCPICRYEFPRRGALPWKPVAVVVLIAFLLPVIWLLVRLLAR